jgi:hypothetical protein
VGNILAVGPLGLFGFERDVSESRPLKPIAEYPYPHRILKLCMHCWGSKELRAVIADLLLLPHAIFDLGETARMVSYMRVSHLDPSGCHAGRALLCRSQTMLSAS